MTIEESYNRLQEEHRQLQEDYAHLSAMFENMGKGYEEALDLYDQAMESSRMKTDFIQQISHEIRTPLNILSGFTQVLTSGMELDEATRQEVTKGIVDNTQRITSLVNKMLELSEAGSDTPLERNDQALAIQIAAQAAEDSGITQATHLDFDLDIATEAETVMLTTSLVPATRALVLLLDNAMKFTHPAEAAGGVNAVKEKAHAVLRVAVDDGAVVFTVEDTGIGVPSEEAERIFDEFVQLDRYYDGTGIGLTVARSLARRLGGDIRLDTDYTAGSSVSPGIWNVFPVENLDHIDIVGGIISHIPRVHDLYHSIMDAIASTKPGKSTPAPAPAPSRHEGCPSANMTDVPEGAWFHTFVDYVLEHGLMSGTSATTFSPDNTVTRAMVVQTLYAMDGKPATGASAPFTDVSSGQYYAAAVAWAHSHGVVSGYDDGTFRPDTAITRQQLVTILYAYAVYRNADTSPRASMDGFADAGQVENYAAVPTQWALASGLIQGRSTDTGTRICPNDTAMRSELAVMLKNLREKIL